MDLSKARPLKHVVTKVRRVDGSVVLEDGTTSVTPSAPEAVLIEAAVDESVCFLPGECVAIGAHDAALNLAVMQRNGITHVLNVAFGANAFPHTLQYCNIPLLDTETQPLTLDTLDACFAFIDAGCAAGGKVFIHCNMGVSRSATVAIAWLMMKRGMSFERAYATLKQTRPCVRPNAGFERQLRSL